MASDVGARPNGPSMPPGDAPSSAGWASSFPVPIDALAEPVFILAADRDDAGRIVELRYVAVNDAWLRLFGRSRDEAIGHGVLELFPGTRTSGLWDRALDVISTGETVIAAAESFDDGGVRGSFEFSGSPFGDGLLVMMRDITERVDAQQQLRHEFDFNNAVLRVAGALVMVTDDQGRIVRFNRQAELLSGYREDEVLGSHYGLIVPPAERAAVVDKLRSVSGDELISHINHYLTKSGDQRLLRWSNAALFDDRGARTHVIVVGIDITEQSFAEAELARRADDLERANDELERANAELARSNADLEQFAYIASHDLGEPLRAIAWPIRRLAEKHKGKLDERTDEYLDFAVDGCQRMQDRISALLALSRIGRVEEAMVPVNAADILAEALANLRAVLESSGAVVVADEPLPVVVAEPDQLCEVFQNLISNAVKFVDPGVIPRVRIAAEGTSLAWRFTFTDNGIGIAPEHRDRIFTMFKRIGATGDYPGSGIGLAIVKRVIERHGGEVGVEAAPGGSGSTLWFTLPRFDEA